MNAEQHTRSAPEARVQEGRTAQEFEWNAICAVFRNVAGFWMLLDLPTCNIKSLSYCVSPEQIPVKGLVPHAVQSPDRPLSAIGEELF
jgi:hypothetical protein